MDLDLGSLDLERAVFELRFDSAYLLWGRAGEIMQVFTHYSPEFKVKDATPYKINGTIRDGLFFLIEIGSINFTMIRPKRSLERFAREVEELARAVLDILEISAFNRVGFRTTYLKVFDKAESGVEAVSYLTDILGIKKPDDKFIELDEPRFSSVEFKQTFEDDSNGISINCRSIRNTLNVDVTPEAHWAPVESDEYQRFVAEVDIDYFTKESVLREQLVIGEWVNSAHQLIKRDINKIVRRQ